MTRNVYWLSKWFI